MAPVDAKAIGRRIAKVRKQLNWLQRDLAEVTGIRPGTIGGYEAGWRIPLLKNLCAIAMALNRSVDFLALGRRGGQPGRRIPGKYEGNRGGRPANPLPSGVSPAPPRSDEQG